MSEKFVLRSEQLRHRRSTQSFLLSHSDIAAVSSPHPHLGPDHYILSGSGLDATHPHSAWLAAQGTRTTARLDLDLDTVICV